MAVKKTPKTEKTPRAEGERSEQKLETATFAEGCFWGVQDLFDRIKGVKESMAGYTGGKTENPTYKDVCTDLTGHAEAVQLKFDPKVITYEKLLEVFFNSHDPTTLDRQGPDEGNQYRSAIFYHNAEQKKLAEKAKERFQKEYDRPIVTEIVPASKFYNAEEYHQKYDEKNGFSCHIIDMEKIKHLLK
ncbi:MAG: peptide-methionine (S)-S-oxide reductase MsrA [Candidatus Micrarchaeia archaeon]